MKKTHLFISLGAVAISAIALSLALVPHAAHEDHVAHAVCEHVGNHYAEKDPTRTEAGHKEFWACCKCHEVFLTLPEGTFTDADEALMTGGLGDAHPAYVAPYELEIAVWGRYISSALMDDLMDGFDTYCQGLSIDISNIHVTYYQGATNSDPYYGIANYTAAAKPTSPDILFPVGVNITSSTDSAYYGDESVTKVKLGTINGQTNRYIAKTNSETLTEAFYDFVSSDDGKAIILDK